MQRNLASLLIALALCLGGAEARAQGQDSTPGERHLRVMAELLPGAWDNANQHYFDRRRGLEEADRHPRIHTEITPIEAPALGAHAFLWVNRTGEGEGKGDGRSWRIATLSADGPDDAVVMRHSFGAGAVPDAEALRALSPGDLRRTEGCDYVFQRRAGQFRGRQAERACRFQWEGEAVYTDNTIELSENELWFHDHKYRERDGVRITGVASGEPFWLERARRFHCYADIPGVGGGRDIPFRRYDDIVLHDKGDVHWFATDEEPPREIGVMLQSVTWHVLNERGGNFNRDSLVLYTMERLADGSVKEHGYAFTEPGAERIGQNLKWMLVNCALTPRAEARPEM